jgi:hypothetical protein
LNWPRGPALIAATSACCSGVKRSGGMGGSRIGAMALNRAGFARSFGSLDFVVVDLMDFDLAGTDLAGIGIPELGLF